MILNIFLHFYFILLISYFFQNLKTSPHLTGYLVITNYFTYQFITILEYCWFLEPLFRDALHFS